MSRRVNGRQHGRNMPLKGKYRAILKEVSIPHNDMFPAIHGNLVNIHAQPSKWQPSGPQDMPIMLF